MQNYSRSVLIIGTGSLGLATGLTLRQQGFEVWFDDIDSRRVDYLRKKNLNVYSTDIIHKGFEYIYVCVPTPTIQDEISIESLKSALQKVTAIANRSQHIVIIIRSTILPGTMDETVLPWLKRNIKHQKYGVCYHPAFMRERKGVKDESHPWISVIACDKQSTENKIKAILKKLGGTYFNVTFQEAELIKYGSNLFNALKISYFNQIFLYSKSLNINGKKIARAIAEAAEGNWNPVYGTKPGRPFDGKCLPKDLTAFVTFLDKAKIGDSSLLKAIIKINKTVQD